MANFKWDTRRQHRIHLSRRGGLEIVRGCLVTGLSVVDSFDTGTDPEVFIKAMVDPQCPELGTLYPSSRYPFNLAELEDISPASDPSMAQDQCRLEFIYRLTSPSIHHGEAIWVTSDGGQGSYVEVNATTFGTNAIRVFYKQGVPQTFVFNPTVLDLTPESEPGNACYKNAVRGTHRFYPQRTIRATTQLVKDDWDILKTTLRLNAGSINSQTWGSAARGTWLFLYSTSTTSDYGASRNIECNFLYNQYGWYPIGLYYDRHGERPTDSSVAVFLYFVGPPPVDELQMANGITRASVYPEFDFNAVFGFLPDD